MNSNKSQTDKKKSRKKTSKKFVKSGNQELTIGFAQQVKLDTKKANLMDFFYQTDV